MRISIIPNRLKKIKNLFLLAFVFVPGTVFCQPGQFVLKSNITNLDAFGKAYLVYTKGTARITDSAKIEKGIFEFKGEITSPGSAIIVIDHKGIGLINLKQAIGDALLFYIEPGNLIIAGADSISKAKISGSKINSDSETFKSLIKPVDRKIAALNKEFATSSPKQKSSVSFRNEINAQVEKLTAERKTISKSFIEQNPDSYISIEALESFGLNPDLKEVDPLFANLSPSVKETEAGKWYAALLIKLKSLVIGAAAPEFTQNDENGKPVNLSDYKGKYVLIDFWAAWCGPCRIENPNVVKNYQKYKDKNFTVIGISLDREKEAWIKAIQQDKLEWTHVSDLNYFKNAVAVQYNVNAIPQNFLIDPDGKIIAINVRGEELGKKLNKILQ